MTKQEAERQTRQADTLRALGFTREECGKLRRISMTMKRYPIADRERGALRRLAVIIKVRNARVTGLNNAAVDRHIETNCAGCLCSVVSTYIQTDPRGAALYIIRPGDVPEGADVNSYYSRGICVY